MKRSVLILGLAVLAGVIWAQREDIEGRPELGKVKWGRDFEAALAKGKKEDKPVFALFQEVPG